MYKSLIKISSVVHVYQAIEKAIYSVFLTKKRKEQYLNNEIIYNLVDKNKLDYALNLHSSNNQDKNFYFLTYSNGNSINFVDFVYYIFIQTLRVACSKD